MIAMLRANQLGRLAGVNAMVLYHTIDNVRPGSQSPNNLVGLYFSQLNKPIAATITPKPPTTAATHVALRIDFVRFSDDFDDFLSSSVKSKIGLLGLPGT